MNYKDFGIIKIDLLVYNYFDDIKSRFIGYTIDLLVYKLFEVIK